MHTHRRTHTHSHTVSPPLEVCECVCAHVFMCVHQIRFKECVHHQGVEGGLLKGRGGGGGLQMLKSLTIGGTPAAAEDPLSSAGHGALL